MTLEKMALGGIYDQIGGGFARYSVDGQWHVPHFEKMLYDNAQLISLYSEAYQYAGKELFKEVVLDTVKWAEREMSSPEGLFYSALDADSEGVEGKFYVWSGDEFEVVTEGDHLLLQEYYNVTEEGNWEEEQTNILLRRETDEEFAEKKGIPLEELQLKVQLAKDKLLDQRSRRARPGLDDKCLTAWNGMMIKALAEASGVFERPEYYQRAKKAATFILENVSMPDGGLYRNFKAGRASIDGFLDDYAFFIEGLLALYQADFDEQWLHQAQRLSDYVLQHFEDTETPMLYYTSASSEALIARKHEIMDNVMPSSNSAMAQNLHTLGLMFDEERYTQKAAAMLGAVHPQINTYGSAYSNWAIQLLNEVFGINEIAIAGSDYVAVQQELNKTYIPNKIMLAGTNSTLPLLKDKQSLETKIYICRNKACQLPVITVDEAIKLLKK